MERDGYRCWICNRGQDFGKFLVIDHLRPRSSFEPWNLWLADRSDNLRIACWECNQDKSNFELDYRSPVPVVWRCLVCYRIEGQAEEFGWSADMLLAFCARHRENVNVPVDWPIAGLVDGVWQVAA